jgi:hypothetical protein
VSLILFYKGIDRFKKLPAKQLFLQLSEQKKASQFLMRGFLVGLMIELSIVIYKDLHSS